MACIVTDQYQTLAGTLNRRLTHIQENFVTPATFSLSRPGIESAVLKC